MSAAAAVERADTAAWMGEIPAHWDVARLKYIAKLGTGHTPSRKVPEYWVPEECTIPWFTLADVWQLRDGGRTTTVTDTEEKISPIGLANSSAVMRPKGTVVLSRTASVGFSAILGVDAATSQDFMTWICGPSLEPMYLLYVLRAMKQEFRRLVMGSTHKTIYMPDIERLTIPLPPLGEQRRIVQFIESRVKATDVIVDRKERLGALLDERVAAQVTEAVMGAPGVADQGSRRDPAPVDAMLARVPQGWRTERLKYHVEVNRESIPESTDSEALIDYIDISTVDSHGRIGQPLQVPFADAPSRARRIVHSGDTIVSTVRTYLKAIAWIPPENDGHVCSTGFAVLTPRHGIDSRFLYYWTRSVPFVSEVRARSVGVSYPAVNASDVAEIRIPLPPQDVQREIAARLDESTREVGELLTALDNQLELVQQHRETLIFNAVTGRLQEG